MEADYAEGLYDTLRTASRDDQLAGSELEPRYAVIDSADVPDALTVHLTAAVRVALDAASPEDRLHLANQLLSQLPTPIDQVVAPPQQLLALTRNEAPGVHSLLRPATPLSAAALLTNGPDEPNLGAELRAELASADRVDLLCAFIRWHGLRLLERELTELRERGVPFRVITTTYVGATERRAIDELVNRFGATVRITYETQSTRLHAKAWRFQRNTGFDTAYVGSSNLSRAALVDGLEWNVRLSHVATPSLLRKFAATFDTYWEDASFKEYDPERDGDLLDDALAKAGNRGRAADRGSISLAGLEVRAFPHQETMLEALATERQVRDQHRNLIVAATGTGKTVVAALDFRQLRVELGGDPTLLFVAHRKEILQQSMRTYREALADGNFGEGYVDGTRPERWRHVFASIQSLSAYGIERLSRNHFDVVVVDEFHHAEAASYRRILNHLQPKELLGLTATPERADGGDVRSFFGGRTAAELRLWDALAENLLVPFHYFGISDEVDLTGVEWKRGAYDVPASTPSTPAMTRGQPRSCENSMTR